MEKDPIRTKIGSFCIWINDVLNTFSKKLMVEATLSVRLSKNQLEEQRTHNIQRKAFWGGNVIMTFGEKLVAGVMSS